MDDTDDMESYCYSLPMWPILDGLPWWQRVLCVLQYHKPVKRQTNAKHKYPGMELRDQCARCRALL